MNEKIKTERRITDDLQALLSVLPQQIGKAVMAEGRTDDLLEVVMDLGRVPVARFTTGEVVLSDRETTQEEIDTVVANIGDFDADNRAGLERTLHRISAIRNRRGNIVGLTCRVGRAVYGTIDIIKDLVESGRSILILGKPGVGKTTMLREAARILSEKKRVVIVDTSNEIGGDGDVPHPAVGRARRMQVAMPTLQHEVMIEAVENHNPEVIVIDEIGRELEAVAARTIAERGVQLVGTAHGRTMENLLINPTLSDLIGGIESVTLSDEEARRRRTQKTVLERRSPPTFDVLVEIQERNHLVVHPDVAEAVDNLVRGVPLRPEIRYMAENGETRIERAPQAPKTAGQTSPDQGMRRLGEGRYGARGEERRGEDRRGEDRRGDERRGASRRMETRPQAERPQPLSFESDMEEESYRQSLEARRTQHIYPFGVARNRLQQAVKRLGVPVVIEREISNADVLMTLRTYYRSRQQTILDAEHRGMPIYVLRANTISQMESALAEMFNVSVDPIESNYEDATQQAQGAIEAVLNGQRWMDLPPASAAVRRLQHEMARQANLVSHSYGKEPNRRVRIFREQP
ncbi:MAG: R3H domain-containing nucleic acid-binding protein [Anaerolineaceae bacterium]